MKILILAANPKDTTPLRLDEEVREIGEGLRRAKHRDQFTTEQRWAVRILRGIAKDEYGLREGARDADGDGIREVHCNSCEGAGAGLRTYLRGNGGVHKKYLERYVAV